MAVSQRIAILLHGFELHGLRGLMAVLQRIAILLHGCELHGLRGLMAVSQRIAILLHGCELIILTDYFPAFAHIKFHFDPSVDDFAVTHNLSK
jgi:uncharacterized protein YhhL (DUF1145 family)